jgi:hypothetical protein
VYPDEATSYLAILRKFPKSYPGQLTSHFSTTPVFLPLHHYTTATYLALRLQAEIPLHGRDNRHCLSWFDVIHMGTYGRYIYQNGPLHQSI